jgi:predicted MPP superfamily phosphohydrolase
MAFYAGEIARHQLEILYHTIAVPRLPEAFAGMRVVQISDFHFEEFTESAFLRSVVGRVNALNPDLVALTGDFISSKPLPHRMALRFSPHCAEILSQIKCPLRYAVMGNHDASVNPEAITRDLNGVGIRVLANQSAVIERDGQRLWLAGIRDALEDNSGPNLSKALPSQRDKQKEPLILLAHEPDFADYAVGHDISLVLSGHTHGGQILLPFLPPLLLPDLGKRYVHGYFKFQDGMQLYVNRGIGAVNLPFRFRCPPEITVITLQPAASV